MQSIVVKAVRIVDFGSSLKSESDNPVDQHVEAVEVTLPEGIPADVVSSVDTSLTPEPKVETVIEVEAVEVTLPEGIPADVVSSVDTSLTPEPKAENGVQIEGKAGFITDYDSDKARAITKKLILTINKEVLDRDAKFVVMEVTVGHKSEDRKYYSELDDLSEKNNIPLINLTSHFLSLGPEYDYHLYGHWDAHGHYIAGERSAHFICDNLFH